MEQTKTQQALSTAIKHVKTCINALALKEDKNVRNSLWSASAETEYAVAILALKIGKKAENALWKQHSSRALTIELPQALNSALELLENARTTLEAGDLDKSYEKAWMGRKLLLRASELLEKKQDS